MSFLFVIIWFNILFFEIFSLVQDSDDFFREVIPIELQSWWLPDYGHIHCGTRLPVSSEVSGLLHFELRIVLHNNPSNLYEIRIDTDEGKLQAIYLDLECPYNGIDSSTCAFSKHITLDTTLLTDGWRELRIRCEAYTPDTIETDFLSSSGIRINVQNNNGPDDDYQSLNYCNNQGLIGTGWYTDFEYTKAAIECLPLMPISGIFVFSVKAQTELDKSNGLVVVLDKTHYIPATGSYPEQIANDGTVLLNLNGDSSNFIDIPLNTETLDNGWHTLAVTNTGNKGSASDCSYCLPATANLPSGIAKIWFYVDNNLEMKPENNKKPFVLAWYQYNNNNQQIFNVNNIIQLHGMVYPIALSTIEWSVVNGDISSVSIGNINELETTVSFSNSGVYRLKLEADNNGNINYSEIEIIITNIQIPIIYGNAGSIASSTINSDLVVSTGTNRLYFASISSKSQRNIVSVSGLDLLWTELAFSCSGRQQTMVAVYYAYGIATTGTVDVLFNSSPNTAVVTITDYKDITPDAIDLDNIIVGNIYGIDASCSGSSSSDDIRRFDYTFPTPISGENSIVFASVAHRHAGLAVPFIREDDIILLSNNKQEHSNEGAIASVSVLQMIHLLDNSQLSLSFSFNVDFAIIMFKLFGIDDTGSTPITPSPIVLNTPVPITIMTPVPIPVMDADTIEYIDSYDNGGSTNSLIVISDIIPVRNENILYIASISSKSDKNVENVSGLGLQWIELVHSCSGRKQTMSNIWYTYGIHSAINDMNVIATFGGNDGTPKNAVITVTLYRNVNIDSLNNPNNIITGNIYGAYGHCNGENNKDDIKEFSYVFDNIIDEDLIVFAAVAQRGSDLTIQSTDVALTSFNKHGSNGGDMASLSILEMNPLSNNALFNLHFSFDVDYSVIMLILNPLLGTPDTPSPITPAPNTPSPNTPAPITPAPITPAPNTPAPNTPAPNTPSPITPAPITPAPITPAPNTPAPNTPSPNTPAPNTPAPITPAPNTPAPNTPAPNTPAPNTPAPITPAPITPAPITPAPTSHICCNCLSSGPAGGIDECQLDSECGRIICINGDTMTPTRFLYDPDPYCCRFLWDSICVFEASQICDDLIPIGSLISAKSPFEAEDEDMMNKQTIAHQKYINKFNKKDKKDKKDKKEHNIPITNSYHDLPNPNTIVYSINLSPTIIGFILLFVLLITVAIKRCRSSNVQERYSQGLP